MPKAVGLSEEVPDNVVTMVTGQYSYSVRHIKSYTPSFDMSGKKIIPYYIRSYKWAIQDLNL